MRHIVLVFVGCMLLGCVTRTVPVVNGQLQVFDTGNYRDYSIKDNSIFYRGSRIKGADIKTFEYITDYFSRDKNTVYFGERRLLNADPGTFSPIDFPYCRDKHHVYFISDTNSYIVNDAEPNTFQVLNPAYAKDVKHVYSTFRSLLPVVVNGADAPSFRPHINGIYYSDTNYLYDLDGAILLSRDTLDIYSDTRSPLFYFINDDSVQ